MNCFFIGRLRGATHPVLQVTAIDCYSSYVRADLITSPTGQPTAAHTSRLARRSARTARTISRLAVELAGLESSLSVTPRGPPLGAVRHSIGGLCGEAPCAAIGWGRMRRMFGAVMAAAVCERREMFLTNHALVMAAIAGDPQLRVREIAQLVGVTERAVESIVRDLADAGYLTRVRRGRRNHYHVHLERTFQHPMVARLTLGRLVAALVPNRGLSGKEPAGEPDTGAVIPELSISCADAGESLILSATGQRAGEDNVKRILIYMVVASVLALSGAAAAFALRHHSGSRAHHGTSRVEVRGRGGAVPEASAMRRIAEARGVSGTAPARERGSSHGRRHHRRKTTRRSHRAPKRIVVKRRAADVRIDAHVAGVGVDVRLGIGGIRVTTVGKPTGVHPVVHPPAGVEHPLNGVL